MKLKTLRNLIGLSCYDEDDEVYIANHYLAEWLELRKEDIVISNKKPKW
jgi:hypothetical protein